VPELLPAARQGLLGAGVAEAEADHLLGLIGARAATGQTGTAWQRAALAAAERGRSRDQALAMMLDRYLACAGTGEPVHLARLAGHPPLQPGARRGRVRIGRP
jgi:RNA polymerase-binding transcription factor DksA